MLWCWKKRFILNYSFSDLLLTKCVQQGHFIIKRELPNQLFWSSFHLVFVPTVAPMSYGLNVHWKNFGCFNAACSRQDLSLINILSFGASLAYCKRSTEWQSFWVSTIILWSTEHVSTTFVMYFHLNTSADAFIVANKNLIRPTPNSHPSVLLSELLLC